MGSRSPKNDPSADALLLQTLARNMRAARKRKGMTQAEVAEAIGLAARDVYGRFERAGLWPSIETLRSICKVLGISADALLGIGQEETPAILPSAPDDPPTLRRILGQLRRADDSARRIVEMVLAELDRRGKL